MEYISGGGCPSSAKKKDQQSEQDASVQGALDRIKHKFIVMSGKGGVGKSSTAVNLAVTLAEKGFQVGLMDVDLHGPDIPRMLGITGMLGVTENQKLCPIKYSDHLKVVSIESLMSGKDEAIIWRGPVKYSAIKQFIGDVDWGELDYLIIDSPPRATIWAAPPICSPPTICTTGKARYSSKAAMPCSPRA